MAIFQIDLKKAYDCLDWGFLRCVLIKIGLSPRCTNCIMACVDKVNFSILINGHPMKFFRATRGLRQGFSLSPLLFVLAMDCLSLHIKRAVMEEHFQPLMIRKNNSISHSLFIDDILILGMLCCFTWLCLFNILKKFTKAIGL